MHLAPRARDEAPPAEAAVPADGAAPSPRRPSAFDASDALLASLVQTARLPRKIAERARLALHAQRLFRDPQKKRRRRGRGAAGQQYYADAMQLLRVTVEATGQGREVLERFTAQQDDGHAEREGHGRDGQAHPRGRQERDDHAEPRERHGDRRERHGRRAEGGVVTEVAMTRDEAPDGEPPAGEDGVVEVAATRERGAAGEGGPAGQPGDDGRPGGRRKRRRGGRRRRRRGAGGAGGGVASAPAGS
jgi:poly(A) polymerase